LIRYLQIIIRLFFHLSGKFCSMISNLKGGLNFELLLGG